jgi:Protein of unknown function (DUF4241)
MRARVSFAFVASICIAGLISRGAVAGDMPDLKEISSNLPIISMSAEELADRGLRRESLGTLLVPSGKIVASDVLVNPDRPPLSRDVAPGEYPVVLYRLTSLDPRVAMAELKIAEGNPASWELAVLPGQDTSNLKNGEFFGFPVDAGVGSFYDHSALQAMDKREAIEKRKNARYSNYYDDVLSFDMTGDKESAVMHTPLPGAKVNVAVFSSGWGDGYYPAIWGLDASGKPVALVIDFYVAEDADGVSKEDRYHEKQLAGMSEQEKAERTEAYEAIKNNDAQALDRLLKQGTLDAKTYLPDAREDLQMFAVGEDRPDIVRLLKARGLDGSFSEFFTGRYAYAVKDGKTYLLSYAETLNGYNFRKPLSPELMALLNTLSAL